MSYNNASVQQRHDSNETVLAWFQSRVAQYIGDSLLPATIDATSFNGSLLLCLAHHLFPEDVPNLPNMLRGSSSNTNLAFALAIFEDRLGVKLDESSMDRTSYLRSIRRALQNDNIEGGIRNMKQRNEGDEIDEERCDLVCGVENDLSSSGTIVNDQSIELADEITTIRYELDFIQTQMLKTTTTDRGIQDLERRSHRAKSMLEKLKKGTNREQACDEAMRSQIDHLLQKYDAVSSWVTNVRVWFTEAERIRSWIQGKVDTLEANPLLEGLKEVAIDCTTESVERLTTEHERMEKEIEQFDRDDMTRLRAHVKRLTTEREPDKDLSPADTTTIEITLTTLMALDRLTHLIRKRSSALKKLTLRVFWEKEYRATAEWVLLMEKKIKHFILHSAWWSASDSQPSTADVITGLLDLEQQVATFDQGPFTDTVTMFEKMDRSSSVELPRHLETRQVKIEKDFEALTNDIKYARLVVEHRLAIGALLNHMGQLVMVGEQLCNDTDVALKELVTNELSWKHFEEQVSCFHAEVEAVQRETELPNAPQDTSDSSVAAQVQDQAVALVEEITKKLIMLADTLDVKLKTYNITTALQARAKKLLEHANQSFSWIKDQIQLTASFQISLHPHDKPMTDEAIDQAKAQTESLAREVIRHRFLIEDLSTKTTALDVDIKRQNASVPLEPIWGKISETTSLIEKLEMTLKRRDMYVDLQKDWTTWEHSYNLSSERIESLAQEIRTLACKSEWLFLLDNPVLTVETPQEDLQKMYDLAAYATKDLADQILPQTDAAFEAFFSKVKTSDNGGAEEENNDGARVRLQTRQDELHERATQVSSNLESYRALLDQRAAVKLFATKLDSAQLRGQELLDILHQEIKQSGEKCPTELDLSIQEHVRSVTDLWERDAKSIPFPECGQQSQDRSEANKGIKRFVQSRYDDLVEQQRLILECKVSFDTVDEVKKSLENHIARAGALREMIVADEKRFIAGEPVALNEIQPMVSRAYDYAKEAEQLASYELSFRSRLSCIDFAGVFLDDFHKVVQDLVDQSTAHRTRADWEIQWQQTSEETKAIQKAITFLVEQKDACCNCDVVDNLLEDAESLKMRYETMVSQDMTALKNCLEMMHDTPTDIAKRQQALDSLKMVVNTSLKHCQEELEQLKARLIWKRDMAGVAVDQLTTRCASLEQAFQQLSCADDLTVAAWKGEDKAIYNDFKSIECSALKVFGKGHPDCEETIRASSERVTLVHEKLEAAIARTIQQQEKKKFEVSTELLKSNIYAILLELQSLGSKYGVVYESTKLQEDYEGHRDDMVAVFEEIKKRVNEDLKEALGVNFLLYQQCRETETPDENHVSTSRKSVEDQQAFLENAMTDAEKLICAVSRWCFLHIKLCNIENSLPKMEDVDKQAEKVLKEANEAKTALDELWQGCEADSEQELEKENTDEFHKRLLTMYQRVHCIATQANAQAIITKAEQELDVIRRRQEIVDQLEKNTDAVALESTYRAISRGNIASQAKYSDLCNAQEKKEMDEDIPRFTQSQRALDTLSAALSNEAELMDMLRYATSQAKASNDISLWLTNCQRTINEIVKDFDALSERDISNQIDDMQHDVDQFEKSTMQSFLKMEEKMECKKLFVENIKEDMRWRFDSVKDQWSEACKDLAELKISVERRAQGTIVARKVKYIMASLGDIREKAANWHLPNISKAESGDLLAPMLRACDLNGIQEQERICKALMVRLDQDIAELDRLIAGYDGVPRTFDHQRAEIDAAVKSLQVMLQERRREIEDTAAIAKYFALADDADVLLFSLQEDVGKASTSHVKTSGDKLSRTDLQAKLIELGVRQKYYDDKIKKKLDEAATRVPESGDLAMLGQHLKGLHTRWKEITRLAKNAKNELNRAMMTTTEPLVPRIRKSSLPTRKTSSFSRDTHLPPPLPTSTSLSNNGSTIGIRTVPSVSSRLASSSSASRIPSYSPGHSSVARPKQPSKSAISSKQKTPMIQVTRPATPNEYVADPDNDLDMEIGRIVNEAPYRVKVTMVPGEVGRYWFGEANPKLAYCRVLKSKMVMVRVGGGWAELSQFLRDHALLESDLDTSSAPMTASISTTTSSTISTPRIQEGFIKTRRNRSVSPSKSSQTEHGRGYKDGDKYITVDRYGNQLEVKMVAEKSQESRHRRPAARSNSSAPQP